MHLAVLLSLGVSHEYYGGGAGQDFRFVLPASTAQLLRNGRLIVKEFDGKLHVLFEGDDAGTPVVSMDGATLSIGLALQNPHFVNFTTLGFDAAVLTARYRNSADPRTLAESSPVRLVGPILRHRVATTSRPVVVTLRDEVGATSRSEVLEADDERSEIAFDLRGLAPGAVTVDEAAGAATRTTNYYGDAELAREQVFGLVHVQVEESFYAAPPAFDIHFAARQETLRYYVLGRNYSASEFAAFSVKDNGTSGIVFDKVNPVGSKLGDLPIESLGADRAALFQSRNPVARRATPRSKIQLLRNTDSVIDDLPPPRADSASGNVFVHVAKP